MRINTAHRRRSPGAPGGASPCVPCSARSEGQARMASSACLAVVCLSWREVRARGGRKPQARALFTTAQQPSCSERSNNADGRGRRAPRRAECAALRSLPAWPWVAAARRLSALRGGRRARLWPWLALTMIHPTHCRQMRCAPRVAGRGVTAVVLRKTIKLPFVHWSLCQSQF